MTACEVVTMKFCYCPVLALVVIGRRQSHSLCFQMYKGLKLLGYLLNNNMDKHFKILLSLEWVFSFLLSVFPLVINFIYYVAVGNDTDFQIHKKNLRSFSYSVLCGINQTFFRVDMKWQCKNKYTVGVLVNFIRP